MIPIVGYKHVPAKSGSERYGSSSLERPCRRQNSYGRGRGAPPPVRRERYVGVQKCVRGAMG